MVQAGQADEVAWTGARALSRDIFAAGDRETDPAGGVTECPICRGHFGERDEARHEGRLSNAGADGMSVPDAVSDSAAGLVHDAGGVRDGPCGGTIRAIFPPRDARG